MILTWITALVLIGFARYATARMKEVPERVRKIFGSGWWRACVISSRIIGRDLVKKTFWFFATIFIFIHDH
jgi:F-type H+-transporting ATPase subunit a